MMDQKFRLQRIRKIGFACSLGLLLAGCFQPVNSVQIGNATMANALSDISIGKVDGYLGYILKSELNFLLSQTGAIQGRRYVLNVKLQQSQESPVVDSVTGRAQVTSLAVQAIYDLQDTNTGKLIASGKTFANSNYDRSTQRFSAERARRDAEEKVAKLLAERLRAISISALATGGIINPDKKIEFTRPIIDNTENTLVSNSANDE